VLVDDSIDVAGLPTTGGSIALQGSIPTVDATVVAKLRAAGAIILGKSNVSELNGLFDVGMPEGYSSIGGQVLLPSDTDKTPAGSSAGSAAATAAGLATLTVGRQTSPDTAQLIAPAGVAGVVGLKPTVGLVSRAGVMPVSSSQDSTGALTRTVVDAAAQLTAVAGADPLDPATAAATPSTDYVAGLSPSALNGGRVAVVSNTTAPYPTVVSTLQSLGATTVVTAAATPDPNPPSIVGTEFKRDLNAYLAGTGGTGAKSLAEIIAYNEANPVEGLKYLQGELVAADAVDLSDPATASAYEANLAAGRDSSRALLDSVFTSGTAADPADDVSVIAVPTGNPLIGVADRAGYPILTVPAGYGTGNAGRNPIGVTFIGPAFGEAQLLAAGYAYEQATNVRLAPSVTNPSMFRCVPGSAFFTAERCHPGDPYFRLAAAADAPVATDGTYVTDVDVALDVPAPGVLADDSGSGLSAELEASTAKGSLNFRSDGSFTYVPEPGFVGSVRFTYRAVGATGRSAPATVAIDVRPPNVLPTAGLSVTPVTGTAPLAVTADASSSVDPDGEIVGYSWSFGNGQTASGVTASATYDTPGTYVVSLTVIDDRGGTATATSTVTVAAPPVRDQVSVSFTGSRTYAASGPISSGDLRIARDGIGINRITGTAALPGPTAAPATVTFNLSRLLFLNVFTGSVTVRDPSVAGFGTVTTSATLVPLTSLRSSTASGVLYGSLGFFRPYTLRFSVQDLA
jgi:Asp-tRNA(Asn)/Glu-tRNA(Gln) amidotransferase A subunit family amidase/PKD repeat protein